ncbi:MAG TPA: hypothetical protein VLY04_09285 [Bryobacteraceae bacterium]|nr:hypothetical protein [Bryobacteraceae bacterium]
MHHWDPASLDRVEASRVLLERAVAEMRSFECALRHGGVEASAEVRSTLIALKQEILLATRAVDTCMAFYRGLGAILGGVTPGYDAGGRHFAETAHLELGMHG